MFNVVVISADIRVFKDHLFVQYHRIDHANQLLDQGRKSLTFRSHCLEICPAEEYLSSKRKSSSVERSSKRFVFYVEMR